MTAAGKWEGGSSVLSQAATTTSPGSRSHIVSWEHPREPRPQGCALEPAVLTLLQDIVHLALAQLQLVTLLGLVGVERQVPAGRRSRARISSGRQDGHRATVSPESHVSSSVGELNLRVADASGDWHTACDMLFPVKQ